MKLLARGDNEFELEFELVEKGILFHLLGLYPAVPADYRRLSKGGKKAPTLAENQQLLDEAMQAQRESLQQEIAALIKNTGRFIDAGEATRAWFQRGELESLLQVLNDVRIGNWIALGSPKWDPGQRPQLQKESFHLVMFMELASDFQMFILSILNGTRQPDNAAS
jgi:hypothetical protein